MVVEFLIGWRPDKAGGWGMAMPISSFERGSLLESELVVEIIRPLSRHLWGMVLCGIRAYLAAAVIIRLCKILP
jgi:hypothetical protein